MIFLLSACSSWHIIPGYIDQFAENGESINRLNKFEGQEISAVYIIVNEDGVSRSIIQEVKVQGFKDIIRVLVLMDITTGLTESIEVLEHHETEDYGGYVSEKWFLDRFAGKNAGMELHIVKMAAERREDIVAITGATYTSQAVVDAVNICLKNYTRIIEEVEK